MPKATPEGRYVYGGPVRIVTGWVPPGGFAAWVPWPNTIVVHEKAVLSVPLIAHELVHVRQYDRYGALGFWLRYAVGWLTGKRGRRYIDHPFEVEARALYRQTMYQEWAKSLIALHQEDSA